jgi:hypothetical protein
VVWWLNNSALSLSLSRFGWLLIIMKIIWIYDAGVNYYFFYLIRKKEKKMIWLSDNNLRLVDGCDNLKNLFFFFLFLFFFWKVVFILES